jgi:hypothetical protein
VVPVLDPGRGRTKQGYFWAIARDDRPWGGSQPPAVVYSYAPGRGHIHANTLLGGYRGILQCDGYNACKKFDTVGEFRRLGMVILIRAPPFAGNNDSRSSLSRVFLAFVLISPIRV